jgi:hypothetical protein
MIEGTATSGDAVQSSRSLNTANDVRIETIETTPTRMRDNRRRNIHRRREDERCVHLHSTRSQANIAGQWHDRDLTKHHSKTQQTNTTLSNATHQLQLNH